MGSCCSWLFHCCGKSDEASQFGESGDRTQLIDPVSDTNTLERMQSENYYKLIGTGCPKKTEEHSDLNKILQEMATNVIDIASLGSHGLEQHEYRERLSFYSNKMRSFNLCKSISKLPRITILQDVAYTDKTSPFLWNAQEEELNFILSVFNEADNWLSDSKITITEDLITPFKVHNVHT